MKFKIVYSLIIVASLVPTLSAQAQFLLQAGVRGMLLMPSFTEVSENKKDDALDANDRTCTVQCQQFYVSHSQGSQDIVRSCAIGTPNGEVYNQTQAAGQTSLGQPSDSRNSKAFTEQDQLNLTLKKECEEFHWWKIFSMGKSN